RAPLNCVKMRLAVAFASGSPCSVPTQFVVNVAEIAEQVICSPGFAFTVVGTNSTGSVPTAGAVVPATPAGSWMLLSVRVPEPVLTYVPVVPPPVMVHVPWTTLVHGVPPVSPDDGGFVVFVVEPGVVDEVWFSTRLKPKCVPSTLASAWVTTELSGPVSSVGAAAAGRLKLASSANAISAANRPRAELPRLIKSPPFPAG